MFGFGPLNSQAIEGRLIGTFVGWLLLQTGLAVMRGIFKIDPALWLTRRLHGARRRHMAEIVRWGGITIFVIILWSGIWSIQSVMASYGPHEGDEAAPPFIAFNFEFVPHDKQYGKPGANVVFSPTAPFTGCAKAILLWSPMPISETVLNNSFRVILAMLDARAQINECKERFGVGAPHVLTAFPEPPTFLANSAIDDIINARETLYALYLWRYHLNKEPRATFVTEACVQFSGQLVVPPVCPGNTGGTWRHLSE